jgi:gliding-associated putative ABC transporter substrate-binding component GldG
MSEQQIHEKALQVRKTRLTNLLLITGILVLVNILGTNLFLRLDLTGRGIYSLSSASKQAVRSLEDRLTIKAYFSSDLPPQVAGLSRYLKDMLDDYQSYGRGKVHFEFIDPSEDEEVEQEVLAYGIQPVTAQVIEQDRVEQRLVYLALVFMYKDRNETIPLVQRSAGLEYDITTAIRRVSRESHPVIGFLSGHGMAEPETDLTVWTRELGRQYEIRTVSVDSFRSVPPDIETLFIVGPREGFSEWERYAIDQFIMRGGRTAWLIDAIDADLQQSQQGMAQAMPLGMDAWLAHYGIRVRQALVMDRNNYPITMRSQRGIFQVQEQVPYPFFPLVNTYNREHPMVKDMDRTLFLYVSPIDTSFAAPDSTSRGVPDTINSWPATPPRVTIEPILYSSDVSSVQEDFFFIQPNRAMAEGNFQGGPFPLAATVTGELTSAFTAPPAVPDSISLPAIIEGPVENRLVVVGDATFARDDYVQGASNLALLLNMADWLFQDEALIGIRAKEVDYRPLGELSNPVRILVKWFNILLPPILAILAGLFWWRYRRRPGKGMTVTASVAEE